MQLGHRELISIVLDFLADAPDVDTPRTRRYMALQDIWGRSVAHYLFHAPFLIAKFGNLMLWETKGQERPDAALRALPFLRPRLLPHHGRRGAGRGHGHAAARAAAPPKTSTSTARATRCSTS